MNIRNTECNVLKLWDTIVHENGETIIYYTLRYVHESVDSGKEISNTWNEKTPVIYTNSKKY